MSTTTPAASPNDLRTYLGWAIASAVLCFLPTGLVAVYFAWKSQQALESGDRENAAGLARRARRWFIGTVIIGGIVELVLLAVLMVLGAFGG
jgi:ABC-type Fe3+ transport system permease subunit